jgi:hypothetical protein
MLKFFVALAASALMAIGVVAAGGAQAAPIQPGVPLSPVSQQSAVRAAQNYLSVMPFSRDGLIKQLSSFEGYSVADATYAVDTVTVNWNEQAAKSAQNYLDMMPFSRDGLINQLASFEGFTYAQAVYGVSTTGL